MATDKKPKMAKMGVSKAKMAYDGLDVGRN
jgi:hypothetical protein